MRIGINGQHEIKQIGDITDLTLAIIELDEIQENYPFHGWSNARILCYCYRNNINSISIYPYVDTVAIERIDAMSAELNDTTNALATLGVTPDETEVS